ncbi:hypothetical protein F511_46730 [Dorcoceras hygrometricum]|uniref:Uncharacterized protein n=1 Tax=Dorcoceras hygrometricum TaxID=472368 RepID=A0A2Z6ZST8_9LAMI|nr:hypothetical protein F511_46730 [Dorcoceras hygrometricum]
MHARARVKPRDRAAHPLRTAADSWPLLHVRFSHVAGQGQRSMRDDGRYSTHGDARDIAQRCDVGRGDARRWMCARWRGDARCRAPACALAAHVISDGGRRPAAAPATLRRCRDGWSEFF